MLLKVPSFPALFNFGFLSSSPSFVMILCFVLFFILVFSSHFVSSSLFPSVQVYFLVFTFFTLFFLPSLSFSVPIFTVASVSCDCDMSRGLKIKRILKEFFVFTEISVCQLLSGMKRRDTLCIFVSILHFFWLILETELLFNP